MKKLFKSILIIITALSMVLLTGCGLAKEVGSAVKSTVTEYVADKAEEVGEALDSIPDREPVAEIKSEISEFLKGDSTDETSSTSGIFQEPGDDPDSVLPGELADPDALLIDVIEGEWYSDKDHVALYIHTYGCLPDNYITKGDAKDQGWNSSKGNLNIVLPGMSIGGDRFGNREGILPEMDGIKYYECDINYNIEENYDTPVFRNAERIIFSNFGDVYYTNDHYETFEQLY